MQRFLDFFNWFKKPSSTISVEPNSRLYVICNRHLNPMYAAVQGGHAVAQWVMEHPDNPWKNKTLIFVKGDIHYAQEQLYGADYSEWFEPDMDDACTAIAVMATNDNIQFLKSLQLLS